MRWLILLLIFFSCQDESEDMKLFMSSLSGKEVETSLFPLADDGYLYLLSFGQSNSTAGRPPDGDRVDGTRVQVPDGVGGWKAASIYDSPFLETGLAANGNLIHLSFANALADKYDLDIRMIHDAEGGKEIELWLEGAEMRLRLDAIYDTFKSGGVFTNNIRPAAVVSMHQGEQNSSNGTLGTYISNWNLVMSQFEAEGYVVANKQFICGQTQIADVNATLKTLADSNVNYRIANVDGLAKADPIHLTSESRDLLGKGRWLRRYEEIVFGTLPPDDEELPSLPSLSHTDLTTSGFTLNWTASTDNVGVVGYKIYGGAASVSGYSDGYTFIKEVGNVLTTPMTFVVGVGETEYFRVLAVDAAGNCSWWGAAHSVIRP